MIDSLKSEISNCKRVYTLSAIAIALTIVCALLIKGAAGIVLGFVVLMVLVVAIGELIEAKKAKKRLAFWSRLVNLPDTLNDGITTRYEELQRLQEKKADTEVRAALIDAKIEQLTTDIETLGGLQ